MKSEAELADERRRHEEERAGGLAAFAEIPEIGPELIPVLVEHGLHTPARLRAAGLERLREILGDEAGRAEGILAAAEFWLAARAAAQAEEAAAAERGRGARRRGVRGGRLRRSRRRPRARTGDESGTTRSGPVSAAGGLDPSRSCSGSSGHPMVASSPTPSGGDGVVAPILCRRESCLSECVRRGRWPQAFRVPAVATPEVVERLRGS